MSEDWIKHIKDERIIAIDPGINGGISVYSKTCKEVIDCIPMPESPNDLLKFLSHHQKNAVCYLEKVQGIPGMGATAMFNFGRGFGQLEMALVAMKIPTIEVTPQKWQKELQLGVKGHKTTNEWKTKLKTFAQQLFPNIERKFNLKTKTAWLKVSDSLLIMEYARRQEK